MPKNNLNGDLDRATRIIKLKEKHIKELREYVVKINAKFLDIACDSTTSDYDKVAKIKIFMFQMQTGLMRMFEEFTEQQNNLRTKT